MFIFWTFTPGAVLHSTTVKSQVQTPQTEPMVLMEKHFLSLILPSEWRNSTAYLPAAPLKGSQCLWIIPDALMINTIEKHTRKDQSQGVGGRAFSK